MEVQTRQSLVSWDCFLGMSPPYEKAWASLLETCDPTNTQHHMPGDVYEATCKHPAPKELPEDYHHISDPRREQQRTTWLRAAKTVKAQDFEQIRWWLFQITKL